MKRYNSPYPVFPAVLLWSGRMSTGVGDLLLSIDMVVVDTSPSMRGAFFYFVQIKHCAFINFLVAIGLTALARKLIIAQVEKEGGTPRANG